jgi:hypothetical protein
LRIKDGHHYFRYPGLHDSLQALIWKSTTAQQHIRYQILYIHSMLSIHTIHMISIHTNHLLLPLQNHLHCPLHNVGVWVGEFGRVGLPIPDQTRHHCTTIQLVSYTQYIHSITRQGYTFHRSLDSLNPLNFQVD